MKSKIDSLTANSRKLAEHPLDTTLQVLRFSQGKQKNHVGNSQRDFYFLAIPQAGASPRNIISHPAAKINSQNEQILTIQAHPILCKMTKSFFQKMLDNSGI